MEIKLLKKFWQETELYEVCNLPHPFFHLGMYIQSQASNGQTWLTLCFLLNWIPTDLLVNSKCSIFLTSKSQRKITTVFSLSAFWLMMFLLLIGWIKTLYSSSDRFSKLWAFLLYNLNGDKLISLFLGFKCKSAIFVSLLSKKISEQWFRR